MKKENIAKNEVNAPAQSMFFKVVGVIVVLAIATSTSTEAPKPGEFPDLNWAFVGYGILVVFLYRQIWTLWVFFANLVLLVLEMTTKKDFGAEPATAFDALVESVVPDGWAEDEQSETAQVHPVRTERPRQAAEDSRRDTPPVRGENRTQREVRAADGENTRQSEASFSFGQQSLVPRRGAAFEASGDADDDSPGPFARVVPPPPRPTRPAERPSAPARVDRSTRQSEDLRYILSVSPETEKDVFGEMIARGALLIVGGSGSGKTTTINRLIEHHIARGSDVIVVDPHYEWRKWPLGVHVAGVARNENGADEAEIQNVVGGTVALMRKRQFAVSNGASGSEFRTMVLVIDEYRTTSSIEGVAGNVMSLISEGRKYGIVTVLGSHSKNVAALGFDGAGDMRESFMIVSLSGNAATSTPFKAEYRYGMTGKFSPCVHPADGWEPSLELMVGLPPAGSAVNTVKSHRLPPAQPPAAPAAPAAGVPAGVDPCPAWVPAGAAGVPAGAAGVPAGVDPRPAGVPAGAAGANRFNLPSDVAETISDEELDILERLVRQGLSTSEIKRQRPVRLRDGTVGTVCRHIRASIGASDDN